MRKEQKFLTKIGNWFRDAGWHWFKIPDMIPGELTHFNVSKPYDAYCYKQPHFIAVEGKHLNGFRTFGIKDLRDSQVKGLTDAEKAGGRAYVMLNISCQRLLKRTREIVSMDRCFIFPWKEFRAKGSYSPDELREYEFAINAQRGSYDLTIFINSLHSKPFLD